MNMRTRRFWVNATAGIAGLAAMVSPASAFDLQGHRGARGLAPENTLAAFDKALDIGVDTLELDIAVTSDDVVVISHDPRLNPAITRDGNGHWLTAMGPSIRSVPLSVLAEFDVGRLNPGNRYGAGFPRQVAHDGQRVPTLSGLLQHLRDRNEKRVRLNIEIKSDPYHPELSPPPAQMAALLLTVLREESIERRVTVQSFDWRALAAMRHQAPDITRSCLTTPNTVSDVAWTMGRQLARFDSVPAMVADAGCDIWSPAHAGLTAAEVDQAHRLNLTVLPWTVDKPADMRRMLDLGVDGFITDEPDLALPLLAERGKRPAAGK